MLLSQHLKSVMATWLTDATKSAVELASVVKAATVALDALGPDPGLVEMVQPPAMKRSDSG